jgi:hypothetical protein
VLGARDEGAVADIRADRLRTLFDELDKGIRELDDSTINSEPPQAFFSTIRAVGATRRCEKTRHFVRLLAVSPHGAINCGDEYAEMLGVSPANIRTTIP